MAYERNVDVANLDVALLEAIEYMIVSGIPLAITPEIHIGDVHVLNVANAQINPSTEEKQDTLIALMTGTAANTARTTATKVIPVQDVDAAGILANNATANSANTAVGTTVDVPLAAETAEDATARTGVSLWKRAVNKLIDIKALLTSILAAGTAIDTAMTSVAVNVAAGATTAILAAPAAGHAYWVYGYELHSNVQGTLQLLSAATAKTGIMPVGAGGGVARDSKYPIFKCGDTEALNITTVTCEADGIITYRDVTP